MNIAAIAPNIVPQMRPAFGSAMFVNQAYAAHAHQSVPRISSAWASPCHVGLPARTVVTCVNAKTNTRSKKSSKGATRCSRSSCCVLIRGR